MKNLIILISALFSFSTYGAEVDLQKSKFSWKGTKVTGKHVGLVKLKSATLNEEKGILKSGNLEIDLKTISVSDLEGEWKQKLEGHLKSKDFFNIAEFPIAKLNIIEIKNGKLIGNLTIKGKTNAVKVPFKKSGKAYIGKLKFDRTKFDMIYNSGNFFKDLGDKMIHNDVGIDFNLVVK